MSRKNLVWAVACFCLFVSTAEAKVIVSLFQTGNDFDSLNNNDDWTIASAGPGNDNFDVPVGNTGDIELGVGGTRLNAMNGLILTNPGPDALVTSGRSRDNITAPSWDGSPNLGRAYISVVDNNNTGGNPGTAEENAGTAVSFFPYADGWQGGTFTQSGGAFGPVAQTFAGNLGGVTVVTKPGEVATFQISGLNTSGNFLAVGNGNNSDNLASVALNGSHWEVQIQDNGTGQDPDESFNFLYVPSLTVGVASGWVDASSQTVVPLNISLVNASIQLNSGGQWELLLNNGEINPSNSALFLSSDYTDVPDGADNLLSYGQGIDNTLAFLILGDDGSLYDGINEITADFRFLAIPFNTDAIHFQAVPEPASAALLMLGLVLLPVVRRRRGNSRARAFDQGIQGA